MPNSAAICAPLPADLLGVNLAKLPEAGLLAECQHGSRHGGWLTDVFTSLPAVFIVVLDALPLVGDWLTDHVPSWDEVTDFYDWLFSHAS